MLLGPGRHGDYFDHPEEYAALSQEDRNFLKWFCEEVAVGD